MLEEAGSIMREVKNDPDLYASDAAPGEAHRVERELEEATNAFRACFCTL
jgi:hypothetical protein